MDGDHSDAVGAYQKMQDQYKSTIDLANGRIKENRGVVTVTKASIEKYEENRTTR